MAWATGRWVGAVVVATLAACTAGCSEGDSTLDEFLSSTTTVPGSAVDTGVAETVAPDPAALFVDEGGALVPGDQVLVMLADGAGTEVAEAAATAVGGSVVGRIDLVRLWQIRIPATDAAGLDAAIAAAGAVAGVELAFPNGTATLDEEIWGTPISPLLEDPVYAGATGDGYRMIGVEQAWRYLRGSGLEQHPVHVGITDSGVWTGNGEFDDDADLRETHPGRGVRTDPQDLQVRQPDGTWAVTGPDPGGGHGTGVASIIGADPDDGGVAGIASPVEDLTITTTDVTSTPPYGIALEQVPADFTDEAQVTLANGLTYTTGAFQAIVEQISRGAQVINMSWGRTNGDAQTAAAFRRFFEHMADLHPEVLFVASAGNDNTAPDGARRFPSGLDLRNMITVGNVANDGTTAGTSTNTASANYRVDIAAPGHQAVQSVDATGTVIDDHYLYPGGPAYPNGVSHGGGTSMAAPQVTAAAALLKSVDPTLTAAQLKELLTESARTTITRPDGTDQAIDPGVGGRALAVDEAVLRLIARRLGRDISTPALLDAFRAELGNLGTVSAVAVSGTGNDWTVTGFVDACHPGCTQLTIEVQGQGAIGGTTTQAVPAAPGEATWSVTLPQYPTTIIVRRTDNDAGSRILVDRATLDGHWTGTASLNAGSQDGTSWNATDPLWLFDLQFATDTSGAVTATGTWTWTWYGSPTPFPPTPVTVAGDQVTMAVGDCWTLQGTLSRPDAASAQITGTWTGVIFQLTVGDETAQAMGNGTWTLNKVD
jgi:hypothetical protein